ncbi:MAG: sortase [Patescibacteria group bacterium]
MSKIGKFIKIISDIFIIGAIFLFLRAFGPIIYGELSYVVTKAWNAGWQLDMGVDKNNNALTPVESIVARRPLSLRPVNTTSSIVIEKIGVSAPIIINVDVTNSGKYTEALRSGVAHAKGSALPGANGNTFLFAHSSINFWELGKYATVFNLLGKLEAGDIIVLFYKENRFDYEVIDKRIVAGFNTLPLLRQTTSPVLTLQTCDPPGTTLNRLIVTARIREE